MSGQDDEAVAWLIDAIGNPLAARPRRDALALKLLARLRTNTKNTDKSERTRMEDARARLARKLAGIGPGQA